MECTKLESLPDISKWDISNVTSMDFMMANCKSLKSLPDISKWDITKVSINSMFLNCNESLNIPPKFK